MPNKKKTVEAAACLGDFNITACLQETKQEGRTSM